jgi:hypothetical protein
LDHDVDRVRAAGAEVYVIGNGPPMFIANLRQDTGYRGPILTDPSLAVYRAAQLKRGVSASYIPALTFRTIRSLLRGFRQVGTHGDEHQMGGVLVIDTDGRVLWHFIADGPGDNASANEILRALQLRRTSAPSPSHARSTNVT